MLDNMKILYKIVLAVALLAAVAVGAAIFAGGRLHATDDAYSSLLDHEAKAGVLLARANQRVFNTGRLLYMMIAESDDAKMREISARIDKEHDSFLDFLKKGEERVPGRTAELERARQFYEDAFAAGRDVQKLTLTHNDKEAMEAAGVRFDPPLEKARAALLLSCTVGDKLRPARCPIAPALAGGRVWGPPPVLLLFAASCTMLKSFNGIVMLNSGCGAEAEVGCGQLSGRPVALFSSVMVTTRESRPCWGSKSGTIVRSGTAAFIEFTDTAKADCEAVSTSALKAEEMVAKSPKPRFFPAPAPSPPAPPPLVPSSAATAAALRVPPVPGGAG